MFSKILKKYINHPRQVIKDNVWITIGQIVGAAVSFALYYFFNKYSTPEVVGNYKYIISVVSVIGVFSLNGLNTAIVRTISKKQEGSLKKILLFNLRWSLLIPVVGLVVSAYYFIQGNLLLSTGIIIGSLTTPFIQTLALVFSFLHGQEKYCSISKYKTIQAISSYLLLIVSVIVTQNTLIIVSTYFISTLLSHLLIYQSIRKIPYISNADDQVNPETVQLSKHLSLMGIFKLISENLDSIIIFQILGSQQLAIYSFSKIIPDRIKGFMKNIYTIALPKFSRRSLDNSKENILTYILVILLLSFVIFIAYVLSSKVIFEVLFENYKPSVVYSQIYALTILLTTNIQTAFLNAHKMIKQKYIVNIIYNSFKTISILILVFTMGLWGVIIAQISSQILLVILMTYMIYYSK